MGKAKTPSFILELGLEVNTPDEAELNKRFEAARQLYNACLDEAKRRLELLRQSKEFQEARKMPKTVDGQPNRERTEAFKALNAKFGFSEYDLHIYATKIRNSWIGNHIDSTTAQKIASRAFKAVQRVAFGIAKRVRFKGKGQFKSVEGKTNKTGIRYNTAHVEWKGLKLKCIIDPNDKIIVHGLSHRVKYCRIIKRIFNGKARFFVQLILEGKPYQKFSSPDNRVGLDIGPSTIAVVTDDNATLERFGDELKEKQKEIRRLQRKLDRQRRANNPQNYNSDGTIFLLFRQNYVCPFDTHSESSCQTDKTLSEWVSCPFRQNFRNWLSERTKRVSTQQDNQKR
jgi:transposase